MMKLSKRSFLKLSAGTAMSALSLSLLPHTASHAGGKLEKIVLSENEWRKRLTKEQFYILRKSGTERPFTSPLNKEKRVGTYHCVGCDTALFTSKTKFDSGTGWPSFYDVIDGTINTKTDYVLLYPRIEYHCATCGGHHGHVFKDGPEPTGLRYCNNGLALSFKPATA